MELKQAKLKCLGIHTFCDKTVEKSKEITIKIRIRVNFRETTKETSEDPGSDLTWVATQTFTL